MRILVAIPCLTGVAHVKEAIDSVIDKENVDVLIADNGADEDVKALLKTYLTQCKITIISEPQNIFVNPIWNKFIDYFILRLEYSHLIIMNSDLIMQKDWDVVVKNRWNENPNEILIPVMSDDKTQMNIDVDTSVLDAQIVYEGTAGVFITMNQLQAKLVCPIPEKIQVWFGDNWIYSILRSFYRTLIPCNLLSHHYWSQTIQKRPEVYALIEQDKIEWEQTVSNQMIQRIENLKSK